jgi:hypothetical protein
MTDLLCFVSKIQVLKFSVVVCENISIQWSLESVLMSNCIIADDATFASRNLR